MKDKVVFTNLLPQTTKNTSILSSFAMTYSITDSVKRNVHMEGLTPQIALILNLTAGMDPSDRMLPPGVAMVVRGNFALSC